MDQVILLVIGTIVAVVYILSPVKLSEWILDRLEKFGGTTSEIPNKVEKVRSYYVRSHK